MAQEQTVEATILGIEPEGNGWVKIKTDQGDFTTKWPEPIAEAQAHMGQHITIAYEMGEARQSTRTGQWFPAPRYFKRVITGYMQPQLQPQQPPFAGAPQQPIQQAAPQGLTPEERDMRIMRQTAAKCAVWTMQLVPSEQRTFQNQIAVCEAWMRYFVGGLQATGVQLGNGGSTAALTQEQQMAMAGAGPDDGIPF